MPSHPLRSHHAGWRLPALVAALCLVATIPAQYRPEDAQPRQAAVVRPGVGEVALATRCALEENRRMFAQGVALLCSHEYQEAERCFRQVLASEPNLPMAWWGLAMATVETPNRAADALEQAMPLLGRATPRERQWISTLAAFYEVTSAGAEAHRARREAADFDQPVPERTYREALTTRAGHLLRSLRKLVAAEPKDPASRAFLLDSWFRHQATEALDPATFDQQLDQLETLAPRHPAATYLRMQLWLPRQPRRALAAVARVPQVAPGVATQWSVAGQVLAACGDHASAEVHLATALRLIHRNLERYRRMPYQNPAYAPAIRARAASLAELGDAEGALALAREVEAMPRHPRFNRLGAPEHLAGLAAQIRIAVCRDHRLLSELRAFEDAGGLATGSDRRGKVRVAATLASAYFALGDLDRARRRQTEVVALRADVWDRPSAREIDRWIGEHRVFAALAEGEPVPAGEADGLVRADLSVARGDLAGAAAALAAAEASQPGSAPILARRVWVEYRREKKAAARKSILALAGLSPKADLRSPLFARLAPIAAAAGLPADWRRASTPAVPVPGSLTDPGPKHWQPWTAEGQPLRDMDGQPVDLRDYRGKPVVVILYLGFGCLHCVEQLRTFHPQVPAFRKAGLRILAVGTDTPANTRKAFADLPATERFAYTMLSDRKLRVFRDWRSFDQFADLPLHGTFLLDETGAVRWQDISAEPFQRPAWFLAECQRLLGSR